jgi:hypothetical protein
MTEKLRALALSEQANKSARGWSIHDTPFQIAANPATVLALLDEIDKLKAENAGLLDALERVAKSIEGDDWYDIEYTTIREAIASARKQGEQG